VTREETLSNLTEPTEVKNKADEIDDIVTLCAKTVYSDHNELKRGRAPLL
jgi:hypothetical protein